MAHGIFRAAVIESAAKAGDRGADDEAGVTLHSVVRIFSSIVRREQTSAWIKPVASLSANNAIHFSFLSSRVGFRPSISASCD